MQTTQLIQELQERGLIAQLTDAKALDELLMQEKITLYCGFDPTADSLHLGHLIPVLLLKRFQMAGHRPIALVGGATGMIGDPSFKSTERKLNTTATVKEWGAKIRHQVEPFLSFEGENAAIISNNYNWFGEMSTLDFLRDIGKHFSVNSMIKRESVQQRLNRDEVGISFTEFSYALLQGYDFTQLNKQYQCKLQIGGSDQWGNITAGIDLTRRMNQQTVFGLTVPLITKSDGTKFGKTEGNAIWLDATKCSPYNFYQFWINTADADVYRFLRYFTFLSNREIDAIESDDKRCLGKRKAQGILAEHVTELVHGKEAVIAAQRISQCLFNESIDNLLEGDFAQLALDGMPSIKAEGTLGLIDALVLGGLARSKSEARTFLQSQAVSVNGQRVTDFAHIFTFQDKLLGKYTLLRRGKKHYCLICWY